MNLRAASVVTVEVPGVGSCCDGDVMGDVMGSDEALCMWQPGVDW